jgi:4-amino-4-deoxy-L-arabinose transferase-like glycosyltransferase
MLLIAVPLVAFAAQGLVASASHRDLTVFLIGDDMRQYASDGRNIALHGLLMNQGRPLFTGQPFYFYPLYPYFVALTHMLFDESFYGVIFLQFVLLGGTIAIIAWLASDLFGDRVAWLALAILCVLAEMDFVRYYTISVFTDNLYYPLVAAATAAMWLTQKTGGARRAILAGALGGLATLTRPSMMFVLPLFMLWLLRNRAERAVPRRAAAGLAFATAWMAAVGLATLRNWLVSGRFVLLAESSLQILLFLAPAGVNAASYMPNAKPSVPETVVAAFKLFRDHPYEVLIVEARKLAFMAGFTNLMPSFRIHPEFLGLTGGYVGWWLQVGRRGGYGGAVHVTLLGHVVAFLVASPMTYGYKTMLILMILVVPFVAAFLWRVAARFHDAGEGPRRWLLADQIR